MYDPAHEQRLKDEYCSDDDLFQKLMAEYAMAGSDRRGGFVGKTLTPEEEQELFKVITDRMTAAVRSSVTPLMSESQDHVRLEGSGTYLNVAGQLIILTCAHVTDAGGTDFGFFGSSRVIPGGADVVRADKLDAAFLRIPAFVWTCEPHDASIIPVEYMAKRHDYVENELFFLIGFAGENSNFAFESMQGTATCYCTQINKEAPVEPNFFSLYWRPGTLNTTPATDPEVAKYIRTDDPHGFSGAVVWNTNFIRAYKEGREWSPHDARITGLVTSWDMATESIVARRIEGIHEWLFNATIPS
jgi:hypothetical protein